MASTKFVDFENDAQLIKICAYFEQVLTQVAVQCCAQHGHIWKSYEIITIYGHIWILRCTQVIAEQNFGEYVNKIFHDKAQFRQVG